MIVTSLRRRRQVRQSLTAIGVFVTLATLSCQVDRATSTSVPVQRDQPEQFDQSDTLPVQAAAAVVTPTYEGSGQAVHPDFAAAPRWWKSSESYLAMTPYPAGDDRKENPSLLVSTDIMDWHEVPDGPNPVVTPTQGYLSDPDIAFNPETRELWMYYRAVDAENVIRLVKSRDGAQWSAPIDVARGPNHTIVSPTIVRRHAKDWWMWAVNPGVLGCRAEATQIDVRRSTDGVAWSEPHPVTFPSPMPGYYAWHIDVQWIPSRHEYWALYNAKTAGNCGTTALFLSTSDDGEHWTMRPVPVLTAGEVPELSAIVYRSTFSYSPTSDVITFWYSGAARESKTFNLIWHTVVHRQAREEVFARTAGRRDRRKKVVLAPSVALPHPP